MVTISQTVKYKEKVDDEQLINLIEAGVQNSVGDFLNSSELTRERLRATYEYAGLPLNHLAPQGVSEIVDNSTTETIEAYTAILSELLLSNGRIAKFVPYDGSPLAYQVAKQASDIVNYSLFKKNNGWEILERWMKSALLWKNGIIRWDYVNDYDYQYVEYESIPQVKLDEELSKDGVEVVGELIKEFTAEGLVEYKDVRLRHQIDKSRVDIKLIPPENFRITRDATSFEDAAFVAVQVDMTRSEIRKQWPEVAENVEDWDELGQKEWNTDYTEEAAARKHITGQEYWQGSNEMETLPLEANRQITVTESWLRVDRDGDGISELKRFITAGTHILWEEDVDMVNLAMICPFDIPHEFYGLSMADMTRSSTLASTAILRGFVENTYLTNYSPKLADPNVVDFSALQNLKPKQVIPTNGNPAAAVAPLAPETVSPGTVPLLEYLQGHKEQGTGMSKAAQGLNEELYVSGNSEIKLQQVMSASQKRIQHIARRFAETGFKRLIKGVYKTMRMHMNSMNYTNPEGVYANINPSNLPADMDLEIMLDIGENSNASRVQKLEVLGGQVIPALKEMGADLVVKPDAGAVIATMMVDALGLNPNDFLEDFTTDEFKQKAAEAAQKQQQELDELKKAEKEKLETDAELARANVKFTERQASNALQDNIRQTAVAIDKHYQEWADVTIKAAKEEMDETPPKPDINQVFALAKGIVDSMDPPEIEEVAERGEDFIQKVAPQQ